MNVAAAAAFMLAAGNAQAKLVKPNTYTGSVVVSKVFYAGAKDNGNKNYLNSKYLELYNNSTDTLDVSGMLIGLVESDSKANAWTADRMAEAHKDSIALKQVFRLPEGTKMDPRTTLLIANSAIDHTTFGEGFPNLSQADFEAKDTTGKTPNNTEVPALELVYTAYANISYMNLVQSGPCAIVLLTADTPMGDDQPTTYAYGKDKGNAYRLVPRSKVIDGVDIVKMGEEDIKRLADNVDAGYASITAKSGWTGETVYRKTAYTPGGQTVLFDTDNSSTDFQTANNVQPRQYDNTASGLTELTINIPESGFLAINVDKPFFAKGNILFAYVSASNNASTTDLRYNEFRGDSTLLMKGDWIAVGTPGQHTLFLSDSQGILKTRSTSQAWTDDPQKELTGGQKTRRIYKFVNKKEHVGFERDENYADVKWNKADFGPDEHLYITLTDAIGARIYEACGAESYDALSFIPWHGTMPDNIANGITNVQRSSFNVQCSSFNVQYYDLQGRRTAHPTKGLYILNGRKIVFK